MVTSSSTWESCKREQFEKSRSKWVDFQILTIVDTCMIVDTFMNERRLNTESPKAESFVFIAPNNLMNGVLKQMGLNKPLKAVYSEVENVICCFKLLNWFLVSLFYFFFALFFGKWYFSSSNPCSLQLLENLT